MKNKEEHAGANTIHQSELIEKLGVDGDRTAYFKLGCDMLISAHSDLERHIEKLEAELKTQLELERQYSNQLGRMAQLCDVVIPHLLDCLHESQLPDLPQEVQDGIAEIMDYVDAVRPNDKAHRQAERRPRAATGYSALSQFKEV